jgi:nitric oxide reductase NorD protein
LTCSSRLELNQVKGVLQLYCRALAGAPIEVLDTQDLLQKNIGWVHEDAASTDGTKVFLPPVVARYADMQDNFAWFKVVATHQVAHVEFGSFTFHFETPATVFTDRRVQRERDVSQGLASQGEPNGLGPVQAYTEIGRFLRLFDNRRLAFDLFTILEDCRLDYRIAMEYPGIRSAAGRVQAESLLNRPSIETRPVQEALVELLIHMSLEQFTDLPVPRLYVEAAVMLARIVHRLRTVRAAVEDAAEATLRAYEIISRLPNDLQPPQQWLPQDLLEPGDFSEAAYEALIADLQAKQDASGEDAHPYDAPAPVDYRGDFKPDMVQLLTQLQMDSNQPDELHSLSQEMLEQLLQKRVELMAEAGQGAIDMRALAQTLVQDNGIPASHFTPEPDHGPLRPDGAQGASLEPRDPHTYVYHEWDFYTAAYKPRWCMVKEAILEEGEPTFYNEALQHHSALLNHIKRQFERIMPERLRKTYRLIDGEDVDLNAAIEAWADLRMNVPPDDKVYWHRRRIQRDVAVVFLLDMSASTAEPIYVGSTGTHGQHAPHSAATFTPWRHHRAARGQANFKRIIDIAKESTALLTQALESIGDTYGIYGFSGYGRDNVEFYVIKDLTERFGERTKRRIDNISPLHATRMGPAIRHATTKLEQQSASTKILLLLSDGRPQDRGYSRRGVEKMYAVQDTHMALLEAKQKNITPFCLTVDKAGHDYLQAMCGDMGYEVLDEIALLPARLPMLYRALTL